MENKLFTFRDILIYSVLMNICFYFYIKFFGYSNLLVLQIMLSFSLVILNLKSLRKIIFSLLLFLILFDNPNFYYTDFNIRLWYPIVLVTSFVYIFGAISRKITIDLILIFVLIGLGFIYALMDGVAGFAYFFKYLIFVLLIYSFIKISDKLTLMYIVNSLLIATTFVAIYGFIQLFHNAQGDFSYTYYPDFRPHGFFSETTWYSEFIVFGFLLSMILTKANKSFFLLNVLFVGSLIISLTRNAIVGFILGLFIIFMLKLLKNKKLNIKSLLLFIFVSIGIVFTVQELGFMNYITYKFSLKDDSAIGRLEGFYQSIKLIQENFFIGIGFMQSYQVDISGSTIGSKSFNVFFMFFHIFGFFGFLIFVILLFKYFLKSYILYFNINNPYSIFPFLYMSIFIFMALFAPIHQYPFGMLIVALSIIFYKKVRLYGNE